jgi:hypothetical protein
MAGRWRRTCSWATPPRRAARTPSASSRRCGASARRAWRATCSPRCRMGRPSRRSPSAFAGRAIDASSPWGATGRSARSASGLLESGRAERWRWPCSRRARRTTRDGASASTPARRAREKPRGAVAGRETRLDAGKMVTSGHSAWFFDSAGWGISARVLRARNEDRALVDEHAPLLKALYRDHLVYAGALHARLSRVVRAWTTRSPRRSRPRALDGQRFVLDGLTDLIVKGTRVYGGAWVLDRTSRHDDGLFEMVPFRGKLDWMSKAIVDLDGNPVTEELLNAVGVEHSHPSASRARPSTHVGPGGAAPAAQIDGEESPARSGDGDHRGRAAGDPARGAVVTARRRVAVHHRADAVGAREAHGVDVLDVLLAVAHPGADADPVMTSLHQPSMVAMRVFVPWHVSVIDCPSCWHSSWSAGVSPWCRRAAPRWRPPSRTLGWGGEEPHATPVRTITSTGARTRPVASRNP